jgi:hypothetical protein
MFARTVTASFDVAPRHVEVVQPGGATGSGQGIACSGDPRTRSQDDRQDR